RDVLDEVFERFSATLVLAGTSFIFCAFFGILAGVISASRQYSIVDKAITSAVLVGISIPSFFLGMMLILIFSVQLRWFPVSGMWPIYGARDLSALLSHLRSVVWRHALRAAMVSIIPVLGIQAGFVLSGAVYIEMVFQWPGIGRMLVDAILKRDILLVQGGVVFVAACYVLFNIVVDIAQSILDPRIKT
ncbi:MAG: ABC transporter permease, partial [Rhodobacteraceae bacterium]|nr:ABC transporter permease [Paracoccaceae bacterium]